MDAIKTLFQTRDTAVSNNAYDVFASTQIEEIPNAAIEGYLAAGTLTSDVIAIADDTELKKVAFVKENYGTHSAFLLYYIVQTEDGWIIHDIVSQVR